jgi:hypothetical protein
MFRRRRELQELQRQVDDLREHFGENSPQLVTAMGNLASHYEKECRFDTSVSLRARVVEIQRGLYGDESLEVINALDKLSLVHFARADFVSAQTIQKEIVQRLLNYWDPNSRTIIKAKRLLAQSLYMSHDLNGSYDVMMDVVESSKAVFGRSAPETLESTVYLGDILRHLDRFATAWSVDREVVSIAQESGSDPHLVLTAWRSVLEDCESLDNVSGTIKALEAIAVIAGSLPEDDAVRKRLPTMGPGVVAMKDQIVKAVGEQRYQELLRIVNVVVD